MKKIFLLILPLLAAVSSCSYDDSEVKERLDDLDNKVTELEKQVKSINLEVAALQKLIDGKSFIAGVTTNADGSYTIDMITAGGESSSITLKNGKDAPALAVKKDTDGRYYWTLNGEYVLVDGKKLPASGADGVTPQFKIENNNWYISYDQGKTWAESGKATYDSSLFKSVKVSDDGKQVFMTLADGTVLTFDLYTGFGIAFEKASEQTVRVGETISLPFILTGADDKTLVEVLPGGNWKAEVERTGTAGGVIKVTAPADSQTGKVVVLVSDGKDKTLMRTLTFISGLMNVTTSSTGVPAGGGVATVQVETDLQYTVSIPKEDTWITHTETRAPIRQETLTFNLEANTQLVARQSKIELVSGNSPVETILIYQEAYYDPSVFVVKVVATDAREKIIALPLFGAVKATVNWGDGKTDEVDATISTAAAMIQHTYPAAGTYYVSVKGSVEQINGRLIKNTNKPGIVEVLQWGQLGITSLSNAFTGDTELVKVAVPESGAFANVTLADDMFYKCSALKEVPAELFADGGNITTIDYLFSGCESLESIPEQLFAKMIKVTSASYLFSSCKKLESVPAGLFRNNTALEDLSSAFGTSGLKSIPDDLFRGLTAVENLAGLFSGAAGIETLPAGLFRDMTAVTNISSLFKGCARLTSLPESLFASFTEVTHMTNLFSGCTSMGNLPDGIFKNMGKALQGGYLFENCVKMTAFPSLKSCTSLTTVPAIWKGCTGLVNAPADYFPESVKTGISAAYIFSGCTALKSVPEDLFKNFTGVTVISEMFLNCTSLETLPAGLFDNMTAIKTASKTFSGCAKLTSESPYTTITTGGVGVKVHLYERAKYTDKFTAVTSFTDCFKGCINVADYADIPIPWGGISDGTKAKPTINLTIGLTPGKEYFAVSATFHTTEVMSGNKWTIMTPKRLEEALEELGGDMKRVCTKYGITYEIEKANSSSGVVLDGLTSDTDTEYVFVVMGANAHGVSFEQAKVTTAPMPKGEPDFERYIGTWKVVSTSSEVNKAPQTFQITIRPYRVNESFKITGWGITTLCDDEEFALPTAYANGNITIQSNAAIGLYYPYYVYPMCRFYKPSDSSYWMYKPSTPLISGTYDSGKNQISIWGEKFIDKEVEYTVSGLDYVLFSGGKFYMANNLLKPGYTQSDYSIGPYTLTKIQSGGVAPAKASKSGMKAPVDRPRMVSAPTGAFEVIKK